MQRPCCGAFQSLNQFPHFKLKRDGITRGFGLIPLPPKPFNHLSIVAYLAIGVVVLASSLVAGYLVYSCYHSARSRGVDQETNLRNENNFRDAELGLYEKDEIINDLELENLDDLPGGQSESKRAADTVDSQVFFEDNAAFDPVNCPHLAQISDRSSTFHLPPPPSSPSPAHKQHIRQHAGEMSSPVSPSPSFFPDGAPPDVLTSFSHLQGTFPNPGRRLADAKQQERTPQFDPNNIPPLDTFVTEPTVKLYKGSKLFPAQNATTAPVSPSIDHTQPSQGTERSPTTLLHSVRARTPSTRPGPIESNLISGKRSLTPTPGRRLAEAEVDTENINPILNRSPYKSRWENAFVATPKPGPGFF